MSHSCAVIFLKNIFILQGSDGLGAPVMHLVAPRRIIVAGERRQTLRCSSTNSYVQSHVGCHCLEKLQKCVNLFSNNPMKLAGAACDASTGRKILC